MSAGKEVRQIAARAGMLFAAVFVLTVLLSAMPGHRVPVVDEDPQAASALPTPDSWEWFSQTGETRAPAWRNEVTLRSVEMFTEYEPGGYLPWISPTPLLLLVAVGDHLVPSELAIAAFDRAHQPKELIIMPGGHFDAYTVGFEASSGPARDWFLRHLSG